jgi:hypothetical protein
MCSTELSGGLSRRFDARLIVALLLFLFALWQPLQAQQAERGTEIWLVTYGPGEIYWQRFGHNAIWVRDAGLGLDHVFNFGFFDFEQDNFFARFLQGRMLYFSAAQPAESEFSSYINDRRSIRAQRLALAPEQALRLTDYLLGEIKPQNRDYLYDYYLNNCSTRVRDALDLALGGALAEALKAEPAAQNWRGHTRRLTADDFWLYLGLEIGLASPVDRAISRWDELFIPGELADAVAGFGIEGADGSTPLVIEDVMLSQSGLPPPPETPGNHSWRYLATAAGIWILLWLSGRLIPYLNPQRLAKSWLLVAGMAGVALLYFWVFTNHSVARYNVNLLLFNPLWLVPLIRNGLSGITALLIAVGGITALLLAWFAPVQYNLDVLAMFLPLNLVAAWVISSAQFRK